MKTHFGLALLVCLIVGFSAHGQQIKRHSGPSLPSQNRQHPASVAENVVVTQSLSLDIDNPNAIACVVDTMTHDNSYWRRFDLEGEHGIVPPLEVHSVAFGTEQSDPGIDPTSGTAKETQRVELHVYSIPNGAAFTKSELNPLNSAQLTIGNVFLVHTEPIPLPATIQAGNDLVVEIRSTVDHVNDGTAGYYFPATNSDGETGPSYISSPDCGIDEPATHASIGFEEVHVIMTVLGEDQNTAVAISPDNIAGLTGGEHALLKSWPNPISRRGTLQFATRQPEQVSITLHDALGREVRSLYRGTARANTLKDNQIDAASLTNGLYIVRITGETFSKTRTISVLR